MRYQRLEKLKRKLWNEVFPRKYIHTPTRPHTLCCENGATRRQRLNARPRHILATQQCFIVREKKRWVSGGEITRTPANFFPFHVYIDIYACRVTHIPYLLSGCFSCVRFLRAADGTSRGYFFLPFFWGANETVAISGTWETNAINSTRQRTFLVHRLAASFWRRNSANGRGCAPLPTRHNTFVFRIFRIPVHASIDIIR